LGWDFAFYARGPVAPAKVAAMPHTRDIVCVHTAHALPRRVLARLVDKLSLARVVSLDFMLVDNEAELSPEEKPLFASDIRRWREDNRVLERALARNGRVLLALWPEDARPKARPALPNVPNPPNPGTDAEVSPSASTSAAQNTEAGQEFEWRRPAPALVRAARGLGHVVVDEEGGVVRRVRLWQPVSPGARVPSMGLAMAALASGQEPEQFAQGRIWSKNGHLNGADDGRAVIDWLGGREVFEQLDNSIAYEQALDWDEEDFRDKIVLVGEVSRQSKEIVQTPWGEAPAMQAHANIAAMLLAPHGPPTLPASTWILAACVAASVLVLAPLWRFGLWGSAASALGVGAATMGVVAWSFAARHVLVPPSAPLAAAFFTFNGLALYEYRRARHTLSRFIGPEMIARALHPLSTLQPGEGEGREEEATALFCDLRGYSTLSEALSPRQTALLVNDYTSLLLRATHAWGGRVIDYQGDGAFILFEALPERSGRDRPLENPTPGATLFLAPEAPCHATRAVRAALNIVRDMDQLNARWEPMLGRALAVGIGLQSGKMQIGIIGSSDRVHFGALGDPVNVAARVQEMSKTLPASILLAEGTYKCLHREGAITNAQPRETKATEETSEAPVPAGRVQASGFWLQEFGWHSIRGRERGVSLWGVREMEEPEKPNDE
jgi:class 3 adenylate cyclase/CHASE2 domain-containing sensor protein